MKKLAAIVLEESADLELSHPKTGEGLRSFLILAGPEHPVRKRLELEKDRQMRRQINKKGVLELDEPEEDRKKAVDYLVACTLGWYSLDDDVPPGQPPKRVEALDVGLGDAPTPYSAGAARQIYTTPRLGWIKQQARDGLNKQDVFISDSSRTSSNSPAGSPASPSAPTA